MTTKVLTIDALRSDPALVAEVRQLLAPSYADAGPVFDGVTDAYLAVDDTGRLAAFSLVGWGHPGRVFGEPVAWIGLSASRERDKGRGLTVRLHRRFLRDAASWEAGHGERLLLWSTTAHPLILAIAYHVLADVAPRPDGTCPEDAARRVWGLRGLLPERYRAGPHPLILRGVATSIRYSDREAERAEQARSKLDRDLFREWDINERRGDRLLILGRVPVVQARG